MASVFCINIPKHISNLELELPGIGSLQMIKEKIDSFPRISDYVLKMMNISAPAMAPIRNILRVLDVVIAVMKCIKAIPDSLVPPSPGPILDCITGLAEAVAALLEFIPPFPYVKMIFQIMKAIRQLLDDLIADINTIDAQISLIKSMISRGADTGNTTLIELGECAKTEVEEMVNGILSVFELIGKLLAIVGGILEILVAIMPPLKSSIGKIASATTSIDQMVNAGIPPVEDFPGLGTLVDGLLILRNAIHGVEIAIGAAIGSASPFVPAPDVVLGNP